MMHCITKCSGLENAAMVLIHTSIVSIVDTSCICKLGTIAHIRSIHISHCSPSCTVIIFTSHWTTDGFPISIFPKFPCFVHSSARSGEFNFFSSVVIQSFGNRRMIN